MVETMEKKRVSEDPWRLQFHIMPPVGWLNDPNGLCQFQGIYHVFFQYAPFEVQGGVKFWGHYTSPDLLNWNYEGPALCPDQPFDCHGAYSGSALTEDGKLHLFYTGSVKHAGDYDYINNGRTSSTVYTASEDGLHFGPKKLLMTNADYPQDCTCHVRDPKVWKEGDAYYMVQGARRKGGALEDRGEILVFTSSDKMKWKLANRITTGQPLGYMWECPDYFRIDGRQFLLCCPQGVKQDPLRYQNQYQNGYFPLEGEVTGAYQLGEFTILDYGPDFYAPQTFQDEKGRRILIGWAGMPDADYCNPTDQRGWQHCMTVPRVLECKDGKLIQNPAEELQQLWKKKETSPLKDGYAAEGLCTYETCITWEKQERVRIRISDPCEDSIVLDYDPKNGIAQLTPKGKMAAGRGVRNVQLGELNDLKILADTSILELYFNGGEKVCTTRYYPKGETKLEISPGSGRICIKS